MSGISYKEAGVDIEAGYEAVRRIRKLAASTFGKEVIGGIGSFSGLFALEKEAYKDPVLVSGCDGVGTKLKLAFMMDRHDTVGIDLTAMCVNDILTCGARPLFFLDYIACQKLEPTVIESIIKGIVAGCQQAGCALIGGETAELSDFYAKGEYDLAGFAVGVVEREKIIDGSRIKIGDKLVGLASSGLHSNGFTLARKALFETGGFNVSSKVEGLTKELGEELLIPTKIYVRSILKLLEKVAVKGLAHITGGGLPENVSRILPPGCQAAVESSALKTHPIFKVIQEKGAISKAEMFKVFNMGVGMVVVVDPKDVSQTIALLEKEGEEAFLIGEIQSGPQDVKIL